VSSNVDQILDSPLGRWRTISNARFPPDARAIPDHRQPIRATVRVVCERICQSDHRSSDYGVRDRSQCAQR
jgi:hypothetical protein